MTVVPDGSMRSSSKRRLSRQRFTRASPTYLHVFCGRYPTGTVNVKKGKLTDMNDPNLTSAVRRSALGARDSALRLQEFPRAPQAEETLNFEGGAYVREPI